jgi:hypothetical protein
MVQVDLGYFEPGMPTGVTYRRIGQDVPRFTQPIDTDAQRQIEVVATWEAMRESSMLNKTAAGWTALSVALGAVSAGVGLAL